MGHVADVDGRIQSLSEANDGYVAQLQECKHAISEVLPKGSGQFGDNIVERVAALERNQRSVALGVRHALHAVMAAQEQQRNAAASEGLELQDHWSRRMDEQDRRLEMLSEALNQIMDPTGSQALDQEANTALGHCNSGGDNERNDMAMPLVRRDSDVLRRLPPFCRDVSKEPMMILALEARLTGGISEVSRRVDALQDILEKKVLLPLWEADKDVKDSKGQTERISSQCDECVSRIEQHEVHLNATRAGVDAHEKKLKTIMENVDKIIASERKISQFQNQEHTHNNELVSVRLEAHGRAIEELCEKVNITHGLDFAVSSLAA